MKLDWKLSRLAISLALLAAGAGCSGINASHSVSPLDFLLPGLGESDHAQPPTASNTVAQSAVILQSSATLLVQVK